MIVTNEDTTNTDAEGNFSIIVDLAQWTKIGTFKYKIVAKLVDYYPSVDQVEHTFSLLVSKKQEPGPIEPTVIIEEQPKSDADSQEAVQK